MADGDRRRAMRRHLVVMLVLVGLAMVTGWYDWAVQWLQVRLVSNFETVA